MCFKLWATDWARDWVQSAEAASYTAPPAGKVKGLAQGLTVAAW